MRLIYNLLLGIDQFGNILLFGSPDETISSRLGRAFTSGSPKWFVYPFKALVDFMALKVAGQVNHCVSSIEAERELNHELWSWIKIINKEIK